MLLEVATHLCSHLSQRIKGCCLVAAELLCDLADRMFARRDGTVERHKSYLGAAGSVTHLSRYNVQSRRERFFLSLASSGGSTSSLVTHQLANKPWPDPYNMRAAFCIDTHHLTWVPTMSALLDPHLGASRWLVR